MGEEKIKFSDLEKVFLCGDSQGEPWKHVPLAQARYHIIIFLQDKGYHHPKLWEEGEADTLMVDPGKPTLLTKVEVVSVPPFSDIKRKRKVVGKKLTPGLLNEIEDWIRNQARNQGYPCPEVIGHADPENGIFTVYLERGPFRAVDSVTQEAVPGLGTGTLRRFDAFELGKPFHEDLLDLTSRRVEEDGVLQATDFAWLCERETPETLGETGPETSGETDETDLFQRTFAGKPRLFRIGFGLDTEEYLIFRLSWKHNRWGSKASNFGFSIYASFVRQTFEVGSDWHAFSPLSRWYLRPQISVEHKRVSDIHYLSGNAKFAVAKTWDNQDIGLRYEIGPNLNYTDTYRGAQPGLTRFLSLNYEFEMMSHPFEFWQTDPRTGYQVKLNGDFTNRHLLSDLTAQRFALEGKYYYNFRGYDPPLLVFGVRGGLYGTYLLDGSQINRLPPTYRFFLGGSRNLRGFDLDELPEGFGALSAAFASFEVRLANYLPLWLQPIVFFDIGALGNQALHFSKPIYMSPGFGIRVASPIGVFRTTFAWGLKSGPQDLDPTNTHFQFFIGYGEEF